MGDTDALEITIDIDTKDRANLLDKYGKALKYGRTTVTETRKGFHLRIRSDIEDPLEILRIRKLLGDDPKRLQHDKVLIELGHQELANRLFQWKKVDGHFLKEKPFDILKLCRGDDE